MLWNVSFCFIVSTVLVPIPHCFSLIAQAVKIIILTIELTIYSRLFLIEAAVPVWHSGVRGMSMVL